MLQPNIKIIAIHIYVWFQQPSFYNWTRVSVVEISRFVQTHSHELHLYLLCICCSHFVLQSSRCTDGFWTWGLDQTHQHTMGSLSKHSCNIKILNPRFLLIRWDLEVLVILFRETKFPWRGHNTYICLAQTLAPETRQILRSQFLIFCGFL